MNSSAFGPNEHQPATVQTVDPWLISIIGGDLGGDHIVESVPF